VSGHGELYKRKDGKYGFRIKANNGQIVATGQGYTTKAAAKETLEKVMKGGYKGPITEVKK
jgi:uncharacterized protein YegP (UPF0339 family)